MCDSHGSRSPPPVVSATSLETSDSASGDCVGCRSLQRRTESLEQELAMEKREHVRTTSKLSALLKKRQNPASSEEADRELITLQHVVATLRRDQLQAQEREAALRQQLAEGSARFEQLKKAHLAAISAAAPVNLDAQREITPEWPASLAPPSHADCRAGDKPTAKRGLSIGGAASWPSSPARDASTTSTAERAAAAPSASRNVDDRVPPGYVAGAICVDPPKPKRARTN